MANYTNNDQKYFNNTRLLKNKTQSDSIIYPVYRLHITKYTFWNFWTKVTQEHRKYITVVELR